MKKERKFVKWHRGFFYLQQYHIVSASDRPFPLDKKTKLCRITMWKTRNFVKWLRCISKLQQFHIILGYDEARIYRRIRGNRRSPWRQNCCQFDRSFEQSRYHLPQIWCRYQRHWEVDQQPFAFSSIRVSLCSKFFVLTNLQLSQIKWYICNF